MIPGDFLNQKGLRPGFQINELIQGFSAQKAHSVFRKKRALDIIDQKPDLLLLLRRHIGIGHHRKNLSPVRDHIGRFLFHPKIQLHFQIPPWRCQIVHTVFPGLHGLGQKVKPLIDSIQINLGKFPVRLVTPHAFVCQIQHDFVPHIGTVRRICQKIPFPGGSHAEKPYGPVKGKGQRHISSLDLRLPIYEDDSLYGSFLNCKPFIPFLALLRRLH